jgi:hypothetical protein
MAMFKNTIKNHQTPGKAQKPWTRLTKHRNKQEHRKYAWIDTCNWYLKKIPYGDVFDDFGEQLPW